MNRYIPFYTIAALSGSARLAATRIAEVSAEVTLIDQVDDEDWHKGVDGPIEVGRAKPA